jgi:hypothetical protein
MRRLAWVLGAVCAASACSGGSSHSDGSTDSIIDLGLEWPENCPPEAGNDKGIGLPCTAGGGQCKNGTRCTCDPALGSVLAGVPCFCTLAQFAQNGSKDPCMDSVPANFCGSNATCCDVLTSAAYCVPNVCLIGGACLEFVAVDGGS